MKVHPSVKILQSQGLGSRKICEEIFWESEIIRNGVPFNPEVDQIDWGDVLIIDGQPPLHIQKNVYLLLNKPAGYETSHKPMQHPSVFNLLPKRYLERGVQAAGRLDQDTTGALILSDDGQFIHQLISGKRGKKQSIEKIYDIECARTVSQQMVDSLLAGVELHDEPELISASQVHLMGDHNLRMGITTGKYHQVKRMIAAVGNHVERLHRSKIGPYELPLDLPLGTYIEIDPARLAEYTSL